MSPDHDVWTDFDIIRSFIFFQCLIEFRRVVTQEQQHRVFVVMGVSGSGKSSVAAEAARETGAAFLDGDFLHPRSNILKMAAGKPLTDEDREPWLTALNNAVFAMQRSNRLSIIVCSALKRCHRDRLRDGNPDLTFIYLEGERELIEGRLKSRAGHFFKPEMLDSQFGALEVPDAEEPDVIPVSVGPPLAEVVGAVAEIIRFR